MNQYTEIAQELAGFYMASDCRKSVAIGLDIYGLPTFNLKGDTHRPAISTVIKPMGVVVTQWGVDDPYDHRQVVKAFREKLVSVLDERSQEMCNELLVM